MKPSQKIKIFANILTEKLQNKEDIQDIEEGLLPYCLAEAAGSETEQRKNLEDKMADKPFETFIAFINFLGRT